MAQDASISADQLWLTAGDLARLMVVCDWTPIRWCDRDGLPSARVGRWRWVYWPDFVAFVQRRGTLIDSPQLNAITRARIRLIAIAPDRALEMLAACRIEATRPTPEILG